MENWPTRFNYSSGLVNFSQRVIYLLPKFTTINSAAAAAEFWILNFASYHYLFTTKGNELINLVAAAAEFWILLAITIYLDWALWTNCPLIFFVNIWPTPFNYCFWAGQFFKKNTVYMYKYNIYVCIYIYILELFDWGHALASFIYHLSAFPNISKQFKKSPNISNLMHAILPFCHVLLRKCSEDKHKSQINYYVYV